jgi:hypothetical protein
MNKNPMPRTTALLQTILAIAFFVFMFWALAGIFGV